MNVETKPSRMNLGFDMPSDWASVLDTVELECKTTVFNGVIIVSANIAGAEFNANTGVLTIGRNCRTCKFVEISYTVSKLIKHAMAAFMIRYNEIKLREAAINAYNGNDNSMLQKKHNSPNTYTLYQCGSDGSGIGLVLIVSKSKLTSSKIMSGISVVDCGETYPRFIFNVDVGGSVTKYGMTFQTLLGEYCIGTLSCLNNYAGAAIKEKIKEYFAVSG